MDKYVEKLVRESSTPTPQKSNGHATDISIPPISETQLRALTTNILLERYRLARQQGITFNGARDEYEVLGYDRTITIQQYRDEYARGGIAGRIVDAMPNSTWRGGHELIEDENPDVITPFEQAYLDLDQRLQLQGKYLRVDKLAGLSTFAVLLIGASGELNTELPKASKPEDLLYLTPFLGGGSFAGSRESRSGAGGADCSIYEWEDDPKDVRFGLPRSYSLRRTNFESPELALGVHHTRIIHVAENLLDDDVFGQPTLERVWNLLCDLRKVTGGGAEAFWLRANQGLHLDVDKDMGLADAKDTIEKLKEQSELYKHQITRWLRTRGVSVETLGSDVANFESPSDAILTQISGARAIPKRILTGSEMGELASSQDRENWKDQINGRQTNYAAPYIIRQLVDRLVFYGYLPTPKAGPLKYDVKWSMITTMTEQEKTAGSLAWASTNATQGEVVYTTSEIREKWADKAPLSEEQLTEIDNEAKKKIQRQQEMMIASGKVVSQDNKDSKDTKDKKDEEDKKKPFPRAAEEYSDYGTQNDDVDEDLIRVLQSAIETGATEVIHQIIGLGGAGSGNFDHSGRPGEVGGSGKSSDVFGKAHPLDTSASVKWNQPLDSEGRPIPYKVKTVDEAVDRILKGEVVEVEDVRTAHIVIKKLADIALEAKKAGAEAKDYDLCNVHVKGANLFCAESKGVARIDMPQFTGVARPGSLASKLSTNDRGKVDGTAEFLSYLHENGYGTSRETAVAEQLRATQRQLVGSKVAGMMVSETYDPGEESIFVSRDDYVVDGHHRWAAVIGRDAEDGRLGDSKMNIIRIDAPISEILLLANAWTKKFGIESKGAE